MDHIDTAHGTDIMGIQPSFSLLEGLKYKTSWDIAKFADDAAFARGEAYEQAHIDGNLLLNEGINALLTLAAGGTETAYNNANARLGVGDQTTAEAATQTGLNPAGTTGANSLYKAMDAGYPTFGTSQQIAFRSTFGGTEANFAWNEFTVDNGPTPTKNLNRKVSAQGTKASGQTWQLTLTITLS